MKCLKSALFAEFMEVREARLGAAISEPFNHEQPNKSEARTTIFILIEPPTGCKFQVGRRDKFPFCSGFSVVGADVSFVYAALAGGARPTAVKSAASWAGDDRTEKLRTTTAKPTREKRPTDRPKTAAVKESVK